jgi:hypothetical protein
MFLDVNALAVNVIIILFLDVNALAVNVIIILYLDVNALAVNVIEWFKIRLWFKLELSTITKLFLKLHRNGF